MTMIPVPYQNHSTHHNVDDQGIYMIVVIGSTVPSNILFGMTAFMFSRSVTTLSPLSRTRPAMFLSNDLIRLVSEYNGHLNAFYR